MPLLSAAMVSGLAAWAGAERVTVHGAVAMGLIPVSELYSEQRRK
jgi:hypothetical protein